VEPAPVADFRADSVCFGEVTHFVDMSFSSGQPINSWFWEFADGNTSTDANPNHTYAAPGTYDVILVVETTTGCSHEIVKTVKVHYLPTANFEWQGGLSCEGDTTRFTDLSSSTGSGIIDTWNWSFGDGNTSSVQNPNHMFATPGDYPVTLTVTDINGCESSLTQVVAVSQAPVSTFTFDNISCDSLQFTSTAYEPNGQDLIAWFWDFGDPASGVNNTSTAQHPIHRFTDEGVYTVMHVVTNEGLCSDTAFVEITITKAIADFSFEAACAGLSTNFTDLSNSTSDPIVSWSWDFDDGQTSDLQNPSHVYDIGGLYLVSLTVSTDGGCVSERAYNVSVGYGPTAAFIHTPTQCTSDSIWFTDVSTSDNDIVSWSWQFGDGTTSAAQHPAHLYALPGEYLVKLYVTDSNGCTNEVIENLTIAPSPTANFNFDIPNCDTAFFSDFSNPNETNIIAWYWNFDDPGSGSNNVSFVQNPTHKFSQTGAYHVSLTVSNEQLCSDTIVKQVLYTTQPLPDFSFDTVCFGDTTHFTDITATEAQSILLWEWDFGDGTTSAQQNPSHRYAADGVYQVKLKILNNSYCTDSIIKDVLVRELPIISFAPDSTCINQEVTFVDESISGGESIIAWFWDFGDGTTSTDESPLHTFTEAGTYTITHSVENNFGCTQVATAPFYVNPLPVIDFSFNNACLGSATQFND
ncbi:PKD domain-containing protein, partial [Lentimicrobium sp. S6]|uniref:PKD domain-containing protein n=1 Tax=Lentimicrobium sp. S6 TaxID=2735872 RepID=UPI00155582A7